MYIYIIYSYTYIYIYIETFSNGFTLLYFFHVQPWRDDDLQGLNYQFYKDNMVSIGTLGVGNFTVKIPGS